MPNFNITVNSRFNPLTFQELIAPYAMYKEEFDKRQEALGELESKASVWAGMIDKDKDPLAYAKYQAFANNLNAAASDLAVNGLTPGSRATLMGLRGDYSGRITPIENAYNRKQKLAEEQRQGRTKGLIYNYDAGNTSLDYFLNGGDDYESIDLNTLYTKSAAAFGNLTNELTKYGKGKPVDAYTNTFIQQHGITRQEAMDFVEDIRNGKLNPNSTILNSIYSSLHDSTGVQYWQNDGAENKVKNTILQAVTSGIGKTDVNTLENFGERKMFEFSLSEQAANNALARDKEKIAYQHAVTNGWLNPQLQAIFGVPPQEETATANFTNEYLNNVHDTEIDKAFSKIMNVKDGNNGNNDLFWNITGEDGTRNAQMKHNSKTLLNNERQKARQKIENKIVSAINTAVQNNSTSNGVNTKKAIEYIANDLHITKQQAEKLYKDNVDYATSKYASRDRKKGSYSLSDTSLTKLASTYGFAKDIINKSNMLRWTSEYGLLDTDFNKKLSSGEQEAFNYALRRSLQTEEQRKYDATRHVVHVRSITDSADKEVILRLLSEKSKRGSYSNREIDTSSGTPKFKVGDSVPIPGKASDISTAAIKVNKDLGAYYEITTKDASGKDRSIIIPVDSGAGEVSNSNRLAINEYHRYRTGLDNYIRDQKLHNRSDESLRNELLEIKQNVANIRDRYGNIETAEAAIKQVATQYARQHNNPELVNVIMALALGFDNSNTYNNEIINGVNAMIDTASKGLIRQTTKAYELNPTEVTGS